MASSPASRSWVIVALGAAMANAMVGRWLLIGQWRPDILVISIVYLGLTSGPNPAVIVGFLAGLYQDLYAPPILGTHALSYTVTGYLAGLVGEKVQAERTTIQMASLLTLSLVNETIIGATMGVGGLPSFLWPRAVLSAFYSAILGLLLVSLLSDWLLPRGWGVRDASRRRRVR
ncbi:MAG: rod shape-determining protein MreD [Candidatus Eisenbacteria bacterium]|jgi:rod shape-determining protein MreD|nr:rod shape-determining protein MreD [Candidatus Eisenbacteria bacterium]